MSKTINKIRDKRVRPKRVVGLSLLLIVILTAVVFSPTLTCEFNNWDDAKNVTENFVITQLSFFNIKHIFTSLIYGTYLPLTTLSYAVEYHFFQLDPLPYHLNNLILHIFNSMLVYWLVNLLTRNTYSSLMVALLFAIHPMRVESVVWVSERKDVLYVFFYLGALVSYVKYFNNNYRSKYLVYTFLLFLFSCLSKQSAVTLSVVLLAFDYYQSRPYSKRMFLEKIPFFVMSLLFGVVTIFGADAYNATAGNRYYIFADKIFLSGYTIMMYLSRFLLPLKLSAMYPFPMKEAGMLPPLYYIMPFLVIILLWGVFWTRKKSRVYVFGTLFFLVTVFFALQFFIAGTVYHPDHHTYLPYLGLFFMSVETVRLKWSVGKMSRIQQSLAFGLCGIIILGLSVLTFQRTKVWRNSLSIWNDVVAKYPKISLAYNNRGLIYKDEGEIDLALKDFLRAVELNAYNDQAYNNIGTIYMIRDQSEQALEAFNISSQLNPKAEEVYYNKGIIYQKQQKEALAIENYKKVLELNPFYVQAYNNWGLIFLNRGDYDSAIEYFNKAKTLNPLYVQAYGNIGLLYSYLGREDLALKEYTAALAIQKDSPEIYNNRGIIYLENKQYTSALFDFNQSISYGPDYADAYNNRGRVYFSQNQFIKAINDFDKALEIDPGLPHPYFNRGLVFFKKGAVDSAIENFTKSLSIDPDQSLAYAYRSNAYQIQNNYRQALLDIKKAQELGFQADTEYVRNLHRKVAESLAE